MLITEKHTVSNYNCIHTTLIYNSSSSILSSLFSLVCTALRGKTKAFTEMEANFKVRNMTTSQYPKCNQFLTSKMKGNNLFQMEFFISSCRIFQEVLSTSLQS